MGVIWDKCGRLCGIRVYGLMYAASCFLTAHGTSFSALILGRILGGTSTAILFSVFEAWLVSQSGKLGLSGETLGEIFTKQTIVNSLVAVSRRVFSDKIKLSTLFFLKVAERFFLISRRLKLRVAQHLYTKLEETIN